MTRQGYNITEKGIEVPHEDSRITFVKLLRGLGTYIDIKKQLEKAELVAPTIAEIASLGWVPDRNESGAKALISKLNNNPLWGFNKILYVPNEGAYIQDNPQIIDGKISLNRSDLIRRLEASDPSVRFVAFGYEIGIQEIDVFKRNTLVIALAGEKGADKLGERSGRCRGKPGLWAYDQKNVKTEFLVSTVLDSPANSMLNLYANYTNGRSNAFGILEKAA